MSNEIIGTGTENFDKIPLKERMAFQLLLMQSMLGEKPTDKTDKEWNEEKIKWIEIYAKTVSSIIDNTENNSVRDLIMKGDYKEASNLVIEMLKGGKVNLAA